MSHPRISVFARSANGNPGAIRIIDGQKTLQARTSHDLAIDPLHDEIVVPNPFAEAILFFRGEANGDEAPIRVIQGPKTLLKYSDNVTADPIHNEVYVALFRSNSVAVYRRDVGGDVPPVRIIRGPKTKLDRPIKVAVDPINNIVAVATAFGVWFFNRTDDGDVAPKWVLTGPKTKLGIMSGLRKVVLYPEGKKIIAGGGKRLGSERPKETFIGIWKYGDNGDVPPWAVLNAGPITKMKHGHSMAINPEDKELITVSGGKLLFFEIPEIFE